ncbi:MAG: hypothetical protein ACREE0_09620 [Phenylobacterium sp.]
MAMLNHAEASLEAVTGGLVKTPRVQIPEPAPATSYTSISVTGSTVGVINTASVGEITANIGAMPQTQPARAALATITEAVINDAMLSEADKKNLLDQLAIVAAEAAAEPGKRKLAVIGPMLAAIGKAAGTVTAVATAWSAVEPILRSHFGL